MKRLCLLILTLCLLLLTGCGSTRAGKTQIIRIAFNQNEAHPEYQAMAEFGEKFKEATNGRYEVQIYPNAVLGDQGPVTEMIRTGALQMAAVPMSVPESYNPDFAIIAAPYLYDNLRQMETAAREGVFDPLFTTTGKYNFEIVTLYTSGARHIYTNKPIVTPEDLAGYKIRVQNSDAYIKMIELMGGVGTPMAQGDVYAGIQQKVIEGGENSEVVYNDFKHYEVAPYFSYTNHLVMTDVLVANKDFLDEMDSDTRAIFDRLMKESMEREYALWDEHIENAKTVLQEQGVTFVASDIAAFREKCDPLLQSIANRSEMTREVYNKVMEIKAREEQEG